MMSSFVYSLLGLTALLPAAVYGATRRGAAGGQLFWPLALVALVGFGAALVGWMDVSQPSGFALSLWASTFVTLLCYLVFSLRALALRRLSGLVFPYLAVMGALILAFSGVSGAQAAGASAPPLWVTMHIAMSLVTYALVTLAALLGILIGHRLWWKDVWNWSSWRLRSSFLALGS